MDVIPATFENGIFRPQAPVLLPEGSTVELRVVPLGAPPAPPAAGTSKTCTVEEAIAAISSQASPAAWNQLPSDLTDRLDDYLYGAGDE